MKRHLQSLTSSSTAGFTLLEALVVLIIVAILAGIAAPGWLAFLNRQRMNAVRSDLVDVLKEAQTTARQQRRDVTVSIVDPAVPSVSDGTTQVLGGGDFPAGTIQLSAYIEEDTNPAVSVTFNYQGRPEDEASVPFVFSISPTGVPAQRCVIVANLLGSLKTAEGADCNDPSVTP